MTSELLWAIAGIIKSCRHDTDLISEDIAERILKVIEESESDKKRENQELQTKYNKLYDQHLRAVGRIVYLEKENSELKKLLKTLGILQ
jgi:hypothetical protein